MTQSLQEIVNTLLVWIALNSSYVTDGLEHPHVVLMTAEEITAEYYSGDAALIPETGVDPRINALYAPKDGAQGTIYLRFSGQPDQLFDDIQAREALLHELVHHVQWRSGAADSWLCQNEGELEAYTLGAEYLRQQSRHDYFISRRAWAAIYSRC